MADATPDPDRGDRRSDPRFSEFQEVILAYLLLMIGVALTTHLAPAGIQEYLFSIVLAAMVYLPVLRSEKHGHRLTEYGMHLKNWRKEVLFALAVMLIVFPLFVLGNHFYQSLWAHKHFLFRFPAENPGYTFLEQTLFIAFPEEFFYRGWMLPVFALRWPAKRKLLNADFGKAVIVTSLLFAVGHLSSVPAAFRLAVFFPSLLFCWMAIRHGSLISPILFHGASNTLMAFLNACYR